MCYDVQSDIQHVKYMCYGVQSDIQHVKYISGGRECWGVGGGYAVIISQTLYPRLQLVLT